MFKKFLGILMAFSMVMSMATAVYAEADFSEDFQGYEVGDLGADSGWSILVNSNRVSTQSTNDKLEIVADATINDEDNQVLRYYDSGKTSTNNEASAFSITKSFGTDLSGTVYVSFKTKMVNSTTTKRIRFKDRDITLANTGLTGSDNHANNELISVGQWSSNINYLRGSTKHVTTAYSNSAWIQVDMKFNLTGTAEGNTVDISAKYCSSGAVINDEKNIPLGGSGVLRSIVLDTPSAKGSAEMYFDDFNVKVAENIAAEATEDNTITMSSLTEIDAEDNTITLSLTKGTPKDGELAADDFEVTGLPEGITASAVGSSENKTITFTFSGTAAADVANDAELGFKIKASAVTETELVDSAEIAGGTLISFVKDIIAQLAEGSAVQMGSLNAVSDRNTFEIQVLNGAVKDGALDAEAYTAIGLPEGLSVVAAEGNSETGVITFTVGGKATQNITADTAFSVVINPVAMQQEELFRTSNTVTDIPLNIIEKTIFYQEFDADDLGTIVPLEEGKWTTEAGKLVAALDAKAFRTALYDVSMQNATVETYAEWATYNNVTGIITNYIDDKNYYRFYMEAGNPNRFRIVTYANGTASYTNGENLPNNPKKGTMKFVVDGNVLTGYYNGEAVVSKTIKTPLGAGKIGLTVAKTDSDTSQKTYFSYFKVTEKLTTPGIVYEGISTAGGNVAGAVTNATADSVTGTAIIAVYEDNKLCSVKVGDSVTLAEGESYVLSEQMEIPEEGGFDVKIFFVQSKESIMPLTGALTIK